MSGGRFLVGLREVIVSERILVCRSLIIEDIDFWKEDQRPEMLSFDEDKLLRDLDSHSIEIQESILDDDGREVSTYIADYISRKLEKRSECPIYKSKLFATEDDLLNCNYLKSLSRRRISCAFADI